MSALDKAKLFTDQPGRNICSIHNCCWQCCIWLLAFPYLCSITFLANPWQHQPGNEMRKTVHGEVMRAVSSGSWTLVKEKYESHNTASSVLMIGDASGLLWSQEDGRKKATKFPMGSQTKIMTALLIYKLMDQYPASLSPETLVSRWAPGWPTEGFGSEVKLKHLMAMTSGLVADVFKPGCVGNLEPVDDETEPEKWTRCMTEIAHYEFRYEPGSVFHYGPWNLFVAAGVALQAIGQPLTRAAWINLMKAQIYAPSGLTSTPDFPKTPTLPDVSHGMEMSANEWRTITHTLMFGNLLSASQKATFFADHSYQVDKTLGDSAAYDLWPYREMRAEQALSGGWHYAQGHWIVCDALATKDAQDQYKAGERYTWLQQNEQCGFNLPPSASYDTYSETWQKGPWEHPHPLAQHQVHHSVGEHGSFIWMDLQNQYYGVYVQHFNWPYALWWGTILIALSSCCCCCTSLCIGAQVNYNKMVQERQTYS